MKKIYACLIGEWVCLNDDPNCKISERLVSPDIWYEEGAPVWAPNTRKENEEHSYYGLNYVHIFYKGKDYRINPAFIQIVQE